MSGEETPDELTPDHPELHRPRIKARNRRTGEPAVTGIPDDWTAEQAGLAGRNGVCDICDAPVKEIRPHRPPSGYDTAVCLNGHAGAIECRCQP